MMSASVLFHLIPWNRHFMVSLYVVTASSRAASIVLLKLRALKQQGRDLVMVAWALLGSAAKLLVMSARLTDVLLSHSPERPLLPDPRRRMYVLTHIWGKAERLTCFFQFFEMVWMFSCMFLEVSEAWKSSNSLLPKTSDEKKVLHKVADPLLCVLQPTKPPFPESSGVGGSTSGLKAAGMPLSSLPAAFSLLSSSACCLLAVLPLCFY